MLLHRFLCGGPAQSDSGVALIKEEDPLDNMLCVTPLACRSPSDYDSFSDCFDSQSLVDDDDLGSFVEMDESSDEDLDIFVAMDFATSEASLAAGGPSVVEVVEVRRTSVGASEREAPS
jgi:hypothetical protein